MLFPEVLVLVRGAGDLATGVIYRLHLAGFPVVATETPQPMVVRRTVSFAQAVYDHEYAVEGVTATRVDSVEEARHMAARGALPILPCPQDEVIAELQPVVLVDARMLKRTDAAALTQARLVIGLGPGFHAGVNCHAAIETNRGHHLGRVLWKGATQADTGLPGSILGHRETRLLRAPVAGVFWPAVDFGDHVDEGDVVGVVEAEEEHEVRSRLAGVVRGLLYPGLQVEAGTKIGDVDPRDDPQAIYTISDKSLAIGGAVLTAVLTWLKRTSGIQHRSDAEPSP
ncbi:MAG: EF2563 family selenium-dependent molybdenum hydroxylase system protein [Chloroflexi bacterium]|nr:EF2563 family selenium-dependent molybdenum hydroxylase system protein [Chloroflexota bacterium]